MASILLNQRELNSVCMPKEAGRGKYYLQGEDIVLVANKKQTDAPSFVRFSKGEIETCTFLPDTLLIPLPDFELRFQLAKGMQRLTLDHYTLIDSYNDSLLFVMDDTPWILFKGTYGPEDRPENRDIRHRKALNVKTLTIERFDSGQGLLLFEHATIFGYLRKEDVIFAPPLATLTLSAEHKAT